MSDLPRSYATPEQLEGLSYNSTCVIEAIAASEAGDEETCWKWFALAEIPAYALMACKKNKGANFIRSKGLNTADADRVYGPGWLDA